MRREGTLSGDPALAGPDFAVAYRWMRLQMANPLPTAGGRHLVALGQDQLPRLIGHTRHARGEVLLTARVHLDRILLSHRVQGGYPDLFLHGTLRRKFPAIFDRLANDRIRSTCRSIQSGLFEAFRDAEKERQRAGMAVLAAFQNKQGLTE